MSEMNTVAPAEVREPRTYEDLAQIIELALVSPEFTEEQIAGGCDVARRCGLAAVTVRPSDIDLAERWHGPTLALGAAIDWPYGYSTTAVKQYAARDALRRGARVISVTMNTGKLISRQFQYLEMELLQIAEACHEVHGVATVNLESQYLTEEHKIVACRIAKRAGMDFLATPELADVSMLRQHARDRIQFKLRDVATLDQALAGFAAGCARLETANALQILDSWKTRITSEVSQQNA